jgi:hypothetical protein
MMLQLPKDDGHAAPVAAEGQAKPAAGLGGRGGLGGAGEGGSGAGGSGGEGGEGGTWVMASGDMIQGPCANEQGRGKSASRPSARVACGATWRVVVRWQGRPALPL